MLEVSTGVHADLSSLVTELRHIRDDVVEAAKHLGIAVCGGGSHPFQRWPEQRIYEEPRTLELYNVFGYLAKLNTVFGQHVHVGCSNGDEALYLLHALSRYVPHFVALAASSPYSLGADTLFDCSRLNVALAFPLSGRAPCLLTWHDFAAYFDRLERLKVVESMKDFYWDIRPKPEYGTVEVRICDTPLTVERAAVLAAYLQALCAYLVEVRPCAPSEDDYVTYSSTRFNASRFGLDGVYIEPGAGIWQPLREHILKTLELTRALGGPPWLRRHAGLSAQSGPDDRQRRSLDTRDPRPSWFHAGAHARAGAPVGRGRCAVRQMSAPGRAPTQRCYWLCVVDVAIGSRLFQTIFPVISM